MWRRPPTRSITASYNPRCNVAKRCWDRNQNSGVPACLDQGALRLTAVSLQGPPEGSDGSHLGVSQLQPDKVGQHTGQVQSRNSASLGPLNPNSLDTASQMPYLRTNS